MKTEVSRRVRSPIATTASSSCAPQSRLASRCIRREELRRLVPLSDTTIWEMEQRNEFPRRFPITSRVVAWDLAEVEAWIEQRRCVREGGKVVRAPAPDVRRRKIRPTRVSS